MASAISLSLLVAGCGDQITEVDLFGDWGGEHVSLHVDASGGQIEYDCAHGTMSGPIRPNANGNFEVTGRHIFEHGGPVIAGEPPDEHPAIYRGTATHRTITYTVTVVDTGLEIGPFVLVLGERARLFKCL